MARVTGIFVTFLIVSAASQTVAATMQPADRRPPQPDQIAALRERAPHGLTQALRVYDELQAEEQRRMLSCFVQPEKTPDTTNDIAAWSTAIDQIGGQRNCAVSRLYWYTDLAVAKAVAERTGRPILSLRMLGKRTSRICSCTTW